MSLFDMFMAGVAGSQIPTIIYLRSALLKSRQEADALRDKVMKLEMLNCLTTKTQS